LKITGFIWLDKIVEKLWKKHNVIVEEVQEVLTNKPKFRFLEKGHHLDENVYFALGQTAAGRYLIIFFIYKKDKRALILSARNMTNPERKQYERK